MNRNCLSSVWQSNRASGTILYMIIQRPALASLVVVVLSLAGCSDPDTTSTTAGFTLNKTQPERHEPLYSPSGQLIPDGTIDVQGYVLPLDVLHDRSKGPTRETAPPVRAEIEALRLAGRDGPYEEHRLGPDDGHTQNETSIAVDGDVLVAGWNNYTGSTLLMGVARSIDGGHSWVTDVLGEHSMMSDPAVKAGGNDRWYYAYLASGGVGGSDVDIFVRSSTDAGATWQMPVDASENTSFDDKPYIDALADEVLVGWADFGFNPAKVRAVRSTDGGVTFGSNHVLANNSVAGNGACPVIDAAGIYYMFWRDSWQDSLWVSRSTNQGATWSADRGIVDMHPLPSTLPGGFRIVNLPSADANPLTGDLLVVWNDQRFGDPDILAIRSTDGGQSWSEPVRVNDDAGNEAQFFPWVTFDETGIAHVVWYDRREDGNLIDVYYSVSLDGGMSFGENIRVTAAGFEPILPWDTSLDFIGDYNGIAATAETVYPFYQDSREGNQDVYVALIPNDASAVDEDWSAPDRGAESALSAHPNPFRTTTQIRINRTGLSDPTFVEILGLDGRIIRRVPIEGRSSVPWDGRDDAGRSTPAGIYMARIGGLDDHAVRLVRVR